MKRLLLALIRFYQKGISPLKPHATCRFAPVCSEYARIAIQRFGALRGGWLALCRLSRCNPLFPGGFDPVPTVFAWRRKNRHWEGFAPDCDQTEEPEGSQQPGKCQASCKPEKPDLPEEK